MKESLKLPRDWINAPLNKLADYIQRGKSPKYADHSSLPVINQKCVRWNGVDLDHVKYIAQDQIKNWTNERFLQPRDILWNSTGTGTIGRACLYKQILKSAVVDSHVTIIRAMQAHIYPEFLFYFIMSPFVQKKIEQMQSGSTNQVELSKTAIENIIVPTPPLKEQKRIVDKIEHLFSDLHKGEALLKRIQQQIMTYRQSVLKAAVSGELTKEWRKANQHRLESGDKLLERILEERRMNWQGRGRYKEPEAPEKAKLPDLPEGWVWALGEQLFALSSGKFLPQKNVSKGQHPVYGGNGVNGYHTEFLVKQSTIVIGRVGAHCGNVHITKPCSWITDNAIYATFIPINICLDYLHMVLSQSKLSDYSKGGAQPFVNQDVLKTLLIALPPLKEQFHIASCANELLNQIQQVSESCDLEINKALTLRQSILKAAFSGKLVEQDPNDESASQLLDRIQAKKSSTAAIIPKSKRKQLQGSMS